MTASKNAPKAVKISTSSTSAKITVETETDRDIVNSYSALATATQGMELDFILETALKLSEGKTSVRKVQDSVDAAVKISGYAPTVRKSHVPHFVTAAMVASQAEGADELSNSELLKLAERLNREVGADNAEAAIAEAVTVEQLKLDAPTQTKSKKAKDTAEVPFTFEGWLLHSVAQLASVKGIKDMTTTELQSLNTLMATLHRIATNTNAKTK